MRAGTLLVLFLGVFLLPKHFLAYGYYKYVLNK